MATSTREPGSEPNGWDDEIFADFVSSSDEAEQGVDELDLEKDELKQLLAGLQSSAPDVDAKQARPQSPQSSPKPASAGSPTSHAPATRSTRAKDGAQSPKLSIATVNDESSPQDRITATSITPARIDAIESDELVDAFLQDASRGIAALEQSVIDYESDVDRDDALGRISRELHTLKGAGAIVGLTDLARYIHDIEELIQGSDASTNEITDVLLTCLETLRKQTKFLNGETAVAQGQKDDSSSGSDAGLDTFCDGEATISVRGEQLDRLLDMLTALTMLNNQRDAHVEHLHDINANLSHCANRIRDLERIVACSSASQPGVNDLSTASNPLKEVASDVNEVSRLVRDACSPISREHAAISNFIRQFRNALVSILRTPVSGMFRRLQRAALDAARVEQKQVRLEIVGSEAGLERSVQERLLDPLMHIVRNAVSHGIEPPAIREQNGKDPVGTVTLEAVSAPNLLTLEVRDDGKGLDYDALRRKGVELGLLDNGIDATRQELGQLIFRRGFSTRTEANEIAGRGIGMDVVSDTLEKMHAWVDVESTPSEGTSIKLSVPLKSITEHALVVRIGECLAALPMQYVKNADDKLPATSDQHPQLAQALNLAPTDTASAVVSLDCGLRSWNQQITCLVDEILGPQEVVVRPLPALLRHQKVLSGVTLSATGSIVYVLDPHHAAKAIQGLTNGGDTPAPAPPAEHSDLINVLVVDDSLSARSAVSQLCKRKGWNPVEATNALAALELLSSEKWAAVFTDFDMPQMDGLRFVESLRAEQQMESVPVVMVSSRSRDEMEEKALAAGVTRYLTKPLRAEDIDWLTLQHPIKP